MGVGRKSAMNRTLIAAAVPAIFVLAACGGRTAEQSTSAAPTSVALPTERTASGGAVRYGAGAADPTRLGAPLYPGARVTEAASYGANGDAMAMLRSRDRFGAVYAFYASHLPAGSQTMKARTRSASIATFNVKAAGARTVVQLTGTPGETTIIITHKVGNE
jgi:hypothetical protein